MLMSNMQITVMQQVSSCDEIENKIKLCLFFSCLVVWRMIYNVVIRIKESVFDFKENVVTESYDLELF